MKSKIYLLIFALSAIAANFSFAQNGLTIIPAPFINYSSGHRNTIKIDKQGNIYFATSNNGLAKYNVANGTWELWNKSNSALPTNAIDALDLDSSGNVWMLIFNGVVKFDGTTFTIYNSTNTALPVGSLGLMIACSNNEVWLQHYHFSNNIWAQYDSTNTGLPGHSVNDISAYKNAVWFATDNGLAKLENGTWSVFKSSSAISGYNNFVNVFAGKDVWTKNNLVGDLKLAGNTFIPTQDYCNSFQFSNGLNGKVIVDNTATYFLESNLVALRNNALHAYNLGHYFYDFAADVNGIFWLTDSKYDSVFYRFDKSKYVEPATSSCTFCLNDDNAKLLDVNDVKCLITNNGNLHMSYPNYQNYYYVPKSTQSQAVYTTALWLGGLDNSNNLHLAGQTFRQKGSDYWPGPLDTITAKIDSATANKYDKVWRIYRKDVEGLRYNFMQCNIQNGSFKIADDILTWPATGSGNNSRSLAPYYDYNGDGIYNPYDGDYPIIKADEEIYWIMNDNLAPHSETGGQPLGVEVHAYAYAYYCNDTALTDSMTVLNQTTYYHYDVINRSSTDYHDFYLGLYCDDDLGKPTDDFIACDTVLNIGITYNSDADDDGAFGYGLRPPVINTAILKGPLPPSLDGIDNNHNGVVDEIDERCTMSSFMFINNVNNTPTGNPLVASDYYNYLNAIWLDGQHLTYGENGRNPSNPTTNFIYSGAPDDSVGWNCTYFTQYFDSRFVIGLGPVLLNAGDTQSVDFAKIFTRDLRPTPYNPYPLNGSEVKKIKYWFDNNINPSCMSYYNETAMEGAASSLVIFPNPVKDELNFSTEQVCKMHYQVFDITGRLVKKGNGCDKKISVSNLSKGIYVLHVYNDATSLTQRFVKQ